MKLALCRLLLVVFFACGSCLSLDSLQASAQPEQLTYEDSLAAAKQSLKDRKLVRAIRWARIAVAIDAKRFEAYVIACHALHLQGRHSHASEALSKAIKLCPAIEKAKLKTLKDKLANAISDETYQQHLSKAYQALDGNLISLAANELLAAWRLRPREIQLALEAATALVATQRYQDARNLLLEVNQGSLQIKISSVTTQKVQNLLALVSPIIRKSYLELTGDLSVAIEKAKNDPKELKRKLELLRQAALMMPDQSHAYLLIARCHQLSGKAGLAAQALSNAVSAGWTNRAQMLRNKVIRSLRNHKEVRDLLANVHGLVALKQLDIECEARRIQPLIVDSVGQRMLLVTAGQFAMGSPKAEANRNSQAEEQHEVHISSAFYMAETEVTQKQWQIVMGSNPSIHPGENLPVHRISWNQAEEYCLKLSKIEKARYRLPTEAQWEYVCRAGEEGALTARQKLHFKKSKDSTNRPIVVLEAGRNPWGFYGMQGNVYEWCSDIFAPFSSTSQLDPSGAKQGSFHLAKGGSWTSPLKHCRPAQRSRFKVNFRAPDMGFRVIREIAAETSH